MHFVPDTWLHRLLNNCGRFIPARVKEFTFGLLSHLYTQVLQRRIVRRLVREYQIDVVQEPTPVSATFPSLMFGLGAPIAMGPLNAAVKYPATFQRSRKSLAIESLIAFGHKFVDVFNRLLPGKIQAETLLVANDRTKQALASGVQGKIIELVENGVDFSVWRSESSLSTAPAGQVHFVFLGRLEDWKAVDLLLEAFAAVAQTDAVLEIIGDGHIRGELEAQTARLGIDSSVVFSGWLSQEECALKMQQAHAMVFPSLRECGGAVVMEAMAVALPVIATNWGGPADYLNSTCGILVEPTSKEGFVKGLTDAMLKLAESPKLRQSMGCAGRERVRQHFDWERKVDRILEIYQQTIDDCPKH